MDSVVRAQCWLGVVAIFLPLRHLLTHQRFRYVIAESTSLAETLGRLRMRQTIAKRLMLRRLAYRIEVGDGKKALVSE